MDNNPKNLSDAAAMAQFRLALIAPVIHGLYSDASRCSGGHQDAHELRI